MSDIVRLRPSVESFGGLVRGKEVAMASPGGAIEREREREELVEVAGLQ